MKTPAKIVSLIALGAVTLPCMFYFAGTINLDTVKATALVGTVVWFASTPVWMSR